MPKSKSRSTVTLDAGSTRPPGTSSPAVPAWVLPQACNRADLATSARSLAAAPALEAAPPRSDEARRWLQRVGSGAASSRRGVDPEFKTSSSAPSGEGSGEVTGYVTARALKARARCGTVPLPALSLFFLSKSTYLGGGSGRTAAGTEVATPDFIPGGIVHNGKAKGADQSSGPHDARVRWARVRVPSAGVRVC